MAQAQRFVCDKRDETVEALFTLARQGPDGLFGPAELDALVMAIDAVRATAVAA